MPSSRYTFMIIDELPGCARKATFQQAPANVWWLSWYFWKSLWSSCLLQLSAQQQLLNKARDCSAILVLHAMPLIILVWAVRWPPAQWIFAWTMTSPKQTQNVCKDIKLQKVTSEFLATCFPGVKADVMLMCNNLKQGPLTRRMKEKQWKCRDFELSSLSQWEETMKAYLDASQRLES